MIEEIKKCIELALGSCDVIITCPNQDDRHFEAVVISESFEGLSLVHQHKLVMNALKEKFSSTLHALKLKTLTKQTIHRNP